MPSATGLRLNPEGFRVADAAADTFTFAAPIRDLKVKSKSQGTTVLQGRDFAFAPGALRTSPYMPGIEIYFPLGAEFHLTSSLSPYLSWAEGTVNAGIPTAPSMWTMVSFQDGQPPVLFTTEAPTQFELSGTSGDWRLRAKGRFKGWIRVTAPLGPVRIGSTVGTLGESVAKVAQVAAFVGIANPKLLATELRVDESSVTQVLTFDRPGAAVPLPAYMARFGGYGVKLLTGTTGNVAEYVSGPVAFSKEPRIAIRFPMRRIPIGRSLAVGDTGYISPGTVSAFDFRGVSELALANLTCQRDQFVTQVVQAAREEFANGAATGAGPVVGPALDLLAAHALLEQTLLASAGRDSTDNKYLAQLLQGLDETSWTVSDPDPLVARRSTALLAIAASFCKEPELRLRAAMAQAGLASRTALKLYRERRKMPPGSEPSADPYAALRFGLFSDGTLTSGADPFVAGLLSEVRLLTGATTRVETHANGVLVSWVQDQGSKRSVELLTAYPIEVEAVANLEKVMPHNVLGVTSLAIETSGAGVCQILVRLPEWAKPLPKAAPPPAYSE